MTEALKHQLAQAQAEVARLRALAYVDPAQLDLGPHARTWQQEAQALKVQLDQALPGAAKSLRVTLLQDVHDCETCGSAYEEGATVELNGAMLLDRSPHASCFGGSGHRLADVLADVLRELGYTLEIVSAEADDQ